MSQTETGAGTGDDITIGSISGRSVSIGAVGPTNESGITLQDGEISIYRSAAGALTTNATFASGFVVANPLIVDEGQPKEIEIGEVGPAGQSGITFQNGEAGCNLYRIGTNRMQIDGHLIVGDLLSTLNIFHAHLQIGTDANVYANTGAATEIGIGNVGPTNQSGITFQDGEANSNLYREVAGVLRTDGTLRVAGPTIAAYGSATQVDVGAVGGAGESGITFQNGEAGSNIYRTAAGELTIDGKLHIGTTPTITGAKLAGDTVLADLLTALAAMGLIIDSTT